MTDELDRLIDERRRDGDRSWVDRLTGETGDTDPDLDRERRTFFEQRPFEPFWNDLQRRAGQQAIEKGWNEPVADAAPARPGWWPILRWAAVAGSLVAVTIGGYVWGSHRTSTNTTERAKGTIGRPGLSVTPARLGTDTLVTRPVGLKFFVWRGYYAEPGEFRGTYGEGDRIRFAYWSGGRAFLSLFSVERDGDVHLFYPDKTGASIVIPPGDGVPLDGSVILDDNRGPERFFALFSDQPIEESTVRRAVREGLAMVRALGGDVRDLERLPLRCQQASFWIEKR